MFTAEYDPDGGGVGWKQNILVLDSVVPEDEDSERWHALLSGGLDLLAEGPAVHAAIRLSVRDGRLKRTLLLLRQGEDGHDVLGLVAVLLRANLEKQDSFAFPADGDEHDRMAGEFAPLRYWHQPVVREHQGQVLVVHAPVRDRLPGLVAEAIRSGRRLDYQVNIRPYRLPEDSRRALRKNLLRLRELLRLPRPVLEHQEGIMRRGLGGTALADEFVGTDTTGDASALAAMLLDPEMSGWVDRHPEFRSDGDANELIHLGLHSSLALQTSPWEEGALAADSHELAGLFHTERAMEGLAPLFTNALAIRRAGARTSLERIEAKLSLIEEQITGVAHREYTREMKNALSIARVDPAFSLAKARQILEKIVLALYRREVGQDKAKPLFNMIDALFKVEGLLPRAVGVYLNTIRIMGNAIVHAHDEEVSVSSYDVEIVLLMTLNLVDWYLTEYVPGTS